MKGAAMAREHPPIRSDLGWSTTDRITVRGLDLANEIIGHFNLGDMTFLEFTGRKPTPAESKLFNAVTVNRHPLRSQALRFFRAASLTSSSTRRQMRAKAATARSISLASP